MIQLTARDVPSQQPEDCPYRQLAFRLFEAAVEIRDTLQELLLVAVLDRLTDGAPTLVVKASNEHRKLGAESHRLVESGPYCELVGHLDNTRSRPGCLLSLVPLGP